MLIDSGHRNWFFTTLALTVGVVGLYLVLAWLSPGPLTGGTLVGLAYGLAGAALMIFAGLLSALRWVPSWWFLGPRKAWLKGHIWLGLLSGVLILCHSGFRFGGPLEQVLMVVVILVLATGVIGLLLQQVLPRLLMVRFPREAPFEQIPHLCELLRRDADRLIDEVIASKETEPRVAGELEQFYTKQVRPFLTADYKASSPLANAVEADALFEKLAAIPGLDTIADSVEKLKGYAVERRQYGEQQRMHYLLHGWLLLHVPLSVLLLVLGLAHAFWSLYY